MSFGNRPGAATHMPKARSFKQWIISFSQALSTVVYLTKSTSRAASGKTLKPGHWPFLHLSPSSNRSLFRLPQSENTSHPIYWVQRQWHRRKDYCQWAKFIPAPAAGKLQQCRYRRPIGNHVPLPQSLLGLCLQQQKLHRKTVLQL